MGRRRKGRGRAARPGTRTRRTLEREIVEALSGEAGSPPRGMGELARAVGVRRGEYGAFRRIVKDLFRAGRILHGWPGAVTGPEIGREVTGTYRAHARGFGFVVPASPDSHGDLFIPEGASRDAVTGDVVRAAVMGRRRRRGILEGRVVEVIERGERRFVGTVEREGRSWIVRPGGNRLPYPIRVPDARAKGAREGEKVVVELVAPPAEGRRARGAIVERLGPAGRPDVDALGVLRAYRIPDATPQGALEEARAVAERFAREPGDGPRLDLRRRAVITIDPEDARDFDDAISVRRTGGGTCELGVHIADVASFVAEGGPLDREARRRGNSVYLPRHVVPMLPEILANGIASLQEGEERRTRSVLIAYDREGRVLGTSLARSRIRSARRLTYEEAQAILDGEARAPARVVRLLKDAARLARAIRRRRLDAGMLEIERPEIEILFDAEGRATGVRPASQAFTHAIIETFMIEANEAVARRLEAAGLPFLRRIHPEPEPEALAELRRFARAFGHRLPGRPGRADLQALLEAARGAPEGPAVELAVLRAMERAVYAPEPMGHYGLASACYCHFTSPIRRYADLTVHRLLDALPEPGRRRRKKAPADRAAREALGELGRHLSFTERRAEDAERELRNMKVLQILAGRVGEVLEGIVSGAASFGLFVTLPAYLVDGLVHVRALPDDWWEVDRARAALLGTRTGLAFRVGERLRVRITASDPSTLRLDLEPAEAGGPGGTPGGRRAVSL